MNGFEKQQEELSSLIGEFANIWLKSRYRPRPSRVILEKWQKLLASWVRDKSLPLYIRKARVGRGKRLRNKSGRILIPTDNSTAHWSFSLALDNRCPRKSRVKQLVENYEIPLAFAPLPEERKYFKNNPSAFRSKEHNLNLQGWKLAHIEPVGLKSRQLLQERDIEELEIHFMKFLDPSNMFVVPKRWSGIAEAEEIIEVFRANRKRRLKAYNIE